MSDIVFFLKSFADREVRELDWPGDVKLIGIDPPTGMLCGGQDKLCSSAYSAMASAYRDSNGRILPTLLARYAKGISVDRVAVVGFSAAHGLMNPLGRNEADRRDISAMLLVDSTFGGGKDGYVNFGVDAADGKLLLATTTSNTGGDAGWLAVWQKILEETGKDAKEIDARDPMPPPSGGVWKLGRSLYWYRFVDERGQSELPHYKMGDILPEFLSATLIPYWKGKLGSGFSIAKALALVAAGGGIYTGWRLYHG